MSNAAPPSEASRSGQDAAQAGRNDGQQDGEDLLRRAPSGYLWNQVFSIWLYVSLLLYELVVRRSLPLSEAGIWDLASAASNLGVYVASLGLTSAAAVYLPRALAEGGRSRAMTVAIRLVLTRMAAVVVVAGAILWGLPAFAGVLALTGIPGAHGLAASLTDPTVQAHRLVIAASVVGTGMANLMASLLTSLLRTRAVFIVGGLGQLAVVVLAYIFIRPLGGGADGALAALVVPSAVSALIYAFLVRRVLGNARPTGGRQLMRPMLALGVASWLADLANSAFFKPLALWQLALSVTTAQIALFSSAFQLGHGAALVMLTGITGVSIAILSAAYASGNTAELATAWRTIIKLQVLLTVPVIAFSIPHATAIIRIYGQGYSSAGGMLSVFLAMNAAVQLCGASAHEAALFVLGKQQWVVYSRWGSLGLLALGDMLLIPGHGIAGALVAVALAQFCASAFLLFMAWRTIRGSYPFTFMGKLLAGLAVPTAASAVWRPTSLYALALVGVGFAVLLVICLRLVRPLDAEDRVLLQRVARPLRVILLPFVSGDGAGEHVVSAAGAPLAPSPIAGASGPLGEPQPQPPRVG
jgi:O-antigen/teichoic acid export membrane protein